MSAEHFSRRSFVKLMASGAAFSTLTACAGFNPPSFGQRGGDNQPLSIEVRRALRNHPETSLLSVSVTTTAEGNIRLSGYVNTDNDVYAAERVASAVEGVNFVVNNLTVREND